MPTDDTPRTEQPGPDEDREPDPDPSERTREAEFSRLRLDFPLSVWFVLQAAFLGALIGAAYGAVAWAIYHPEVRTILIHRGDDTVFLSYVAQSALRLAERLAYYAALTLVVLTAIRAFWSPAAAKGVLSKMTGKQE